MTLERRLHGEELPQTKLTEQAVREIRVDYSRTMHGARYYADRYGVSRMAIVLLLKRQTWAWIDDAESVIA